MVEQNEICINRRGGTCDLFQLSLADQSRGIRTTAALQELAGDLSARAGRQRLQLIERLFRAELGNSRCHTSGRQSCAVPRCLGARS